MKYFISAEEKKDRRPSGGGGGGGGSLHLLLPDSEHVVEGVVTNAAPAIWI